MEIELDCSDFNNLLLSYPDNEWKRQLCSRVWRKNKHNTTMLKIDCKELFDEKFTDARRDDYEYIDSAMFVKPLEN